MPSATAWGPKGLCLQTPSCLWLRKSPQWGFLCRCQWERVRGRGGKETALRRAHMQVLHAPGWWFLLFPPPLSAQMPHHCSLKSFLYLGIHCKTYTLHCLSPENHLEDETRLNVPELESVIFPKPSEFHWRKSRKNPESLTDLNRICSPWPLAGLFTPDGWYTRNYKVWLGAYMSPASQPASHPPTT